MENLCSRFEEPDGRNRWDAPLFIVISQDKPLALGQPIVQQIIDAVCLAKAPPPNLSTIVKPLKETNYLHELDTITTQVVDLAIEAQKEGRMGALIVPRCQRPLTVPSRSVTISEWRRLKRQYVQMNKLHTQDLDVVAQGFVDYLNTNLS